MSRSMWRVSGPARTQATPPTQPEFDRVMHANVLGAMQAIPQVAPLVAASRSKGRFAFITSGMAEIGTVASSQAWLYRVSKAALNMGVAAARHDYPGVIMVALSPGWVRTDMGGPGGTLSVEESVAVMRRTLAALVPADTGAFLQHDGRRFGSW
jgi:NAD(P)-dependent dehydrogenase (short-subunit alcohol dehydrogenase family)